MLDLIISSIYFLLPAYVANMCPVFATRLKIPPHTVIHEHYFGAHKRYRGFVAGYIGALLILLLQQYFQGTGTMESFRMLDYNTINIWLYAFLFGFGAITGDLIKSFFKRRMNIASGRPWFPFDQIDLVIGALLFLAPFYFPGWAVVVTLIIITPLLHFVSNVVGYWLGIKKVWW